MKHSNLAAVAVALGLACSMAAARAEQASPTLKKIQETGTISLGYRESSVPFSYYDDNQRVIGYSYEMMMKAVDAVKADLHAPKLGVHQIPVTSQNRISLIQNGTIDIECGSTTNNFERQKQVGFSDTIFVIGTRLLTAKTSGVKDFADLAGKNVVVTAGTTSERLLRKMNDEKHMHMNVISAKDHAESFLTLQSGRAVAFMMDDALLYGQRATAKNPADWVVVGTPQSHEAYGCMLPKGDEGFKKVVDEAIAKAETSGEAAKLYDKWFMHPIPPKGVNLDFPLSTDMKELFAHPNDRAFPE